MACFSYHKAWPHWNEQHHIRWVPQLRITKLQTGWGWQGHQPNTAPAGTPRAGCPAPHPGGFWGSPRRKLHNFWAACTGAAALTQKCFPVLRQHLLFPIPDKGRRKEEILQKACRTPALARGATPKYQFEIRALFSAIVPAGQWSKLLFQGRGTKWHQELCWQPRDMPSAIGMGRRPVSAAGERGRGDTGEQENRSLTARVWNLHATALLVLCLLPKQMWLKHRIRLTELPYK